MKKIVTILISMMFFMTLVSAVWYNPTTWITGDSDKVIIEKPIIIKDNTIKTQPKVIITQHYLASELNFTVIELTKGTFRVDWEWEEDTIAKIIIKDSRDIVLLDDSIYKYEIEEKLLDFTKNVTILENYSYVNETTFYNETKEIINWIYNEKALTEEDTYIKEITYGDYQTDYNTIYDTRLVNTTEDYKELTNVSVPYKREIYKSIPNYEECKLGELSDEKEVNEKEIIEEVTYVVYNCTCNLDKYQDEIVDDILNLNKYPTKNSKIQVNSDYDFSGNSGSFTFSVPYNIFGYNTTGKLFDLGFGTATFSLTSPSDNIITNDNTPSFEFTLDGNVSSYSVELFINDTGYGVNSTVLNNILTTITANNTLADGTYEWYLTAYNVSDGSYNSTFRNITIDTTPPQIDFISPTPANDTTNQDAITISLNTSDANNISAFVDFNNSLVGWWRMDELNSSGTVFDNSTYGNDGQMVGFDVNESSAGKMGQALEFDGVDDYVDCGNDSSLDFSLFDQFSICAWINSANSNEDGYIFAKTDSSTEGYGLYFKGLTNYIYLSNGKSDRGVVLSSSVFSESGSWVQICSIYNAKEVIYYKNGDKVNSGTGVYTFSVPTGIAATIGNRDEGAVAATNFHGSIDDVLIFNRSLSANEIANLYANQSTNYLDVNFTGLAEGEHSFTAYSQDIAGNVGGTEERTVTVSDDDIYPIFYNQEDNNGTLTDTGVGQFNISINNTNGTAYLNINGNSILATNETYGGNIYNATYTFSSAGTYVYNWTSWGNGTDENYNISENYEYVVNASATNTCTCPGLASNWEIDLSDNCNIITNCNISTGNLTFINSGDVLFNATLTVNQLTIKDSIGVIEYYKVGSNFIGWIGYG